MRTFWICLGIPPDTPPCGARGEYQQAASGDSGAAHKHGKDTGHATLAGLNEAALERMFSAPPKDTP